MFQGWGGSCGLYKDDPPNVSWSPTKDPIPPLRFLLLIQRVEVADHLMEVGGVQVGVDLGRLDTCVSEQLLQYAQVSPT